MTSPEECALWGAAEFIDNPRCPNDCPDPTFEVEVMQGVVYQAHGRDSWEQKELLDAALLLCVRCLSCESMFIDRTLEEAVAVETQQVRIHRLDSARRRGMRPIPKGADRCRRRFSLHLHKEP